MKTHLPLPVKDGALAEVGDAARQAEAAGFDGVSYSETTSDPILHLTVAAGTTERVDLITNSVVAFARSPMTLAVQGRALQDYSRGRLVLGLGSQIKPHIEKRFSMPWSAPAARMHEYIGALRAIWHAWETLPALHRARAESDLADRPIDVIGAAFLVTGRDEKELAASAAAVREQIAFYGSTPAYRPVLEHHGWADLGVELNRLSRTRDPDKWARMGRLIDDEVLGTFAVIGEPDRVGAAVLDRWGDVITRYELNHAGIADPAVQIQVAQTLR